MTELILSDITRMEPGLCVIGLEPDGPRYRSVRPGPPRGHAWPKGFPYHRGDRLQFSLTPKAATPPHLEDHGSTGVLKKLGSLNEAELLGCLRRAELATNIRELFQTNVTVKRRGAFIWPTRAARSICGVNAPRVRLKMEAREIRAAIALPSGESLPDLPVVDRSWHGFAERALAELAGANRLQRLNRFLAAVFLDVEPGGLFVRIGVTRPRPRRCWLMVDSLFPMPRKSWLAEVLQGHEDREKHSHE